VEYIKTKDIPTMNNYPDNTVGVINSGPFATVFVMTSDLIGRLKDREDTERGWVSIDFRDEFDSEAVLSQSDDGFIQIVYIPEVV